MTAKITVEVLIAVVAMIVGVLTALYTTAWANRANRASARDGGAYAKAKIHLSMFGLPISTAGTECIFLLPDELTISFASTIRLAVYNFGDAVQKGAILCFEASDGFMIKNLQQVASIQTTPAVLSEDIKFGLSQSGNHSQLSFKLPDIPPKTLFQVSMPIIVPQTISMPLDADHIAAKDNPGIRRKLKTNLVENARITLIRPEGNLHWTIGLAGVRNSEGGNLRDSLMSALEKGIINNPADVLQADCVAQEQLLFVHHDIQGTINRREGPLCMLKPTTADLVVVNNC